MHLVDDIFAQHLGAAAFVKGLHFQDGGGMYVQPEAPGGQAVLDIGPLHDQRRPPSHRFDGKRFIGAVVLGIVGWKSHFCQRLADLPPKRVGRGDAGAGLRGELPGQAGGHGGNLGGTGAEIHI